MPPHTTSRGKIAFLHMPKCGGTSVIDAFLREFNMQPCTFDIHALRKSVSKITNFENECQYYAMSGFYQEFMLLYHLCAGFPFISGHYTVSKKIIDEFSGLYHFVTTLRQPVERFISQYIYDKLHEVWRLGIDENQRTSRERKDELQQYLNSWRGWFVTHIFTWMLGGHKYTNDLNSVVAKNTAKQNLKRFDVVGFTDNFPYFISQIEDICHCRLKVEKKNSTLSLSSKISINLETYLDLFTEKVRGQIEDLCHNDLDIYEFARKYFQP
jgi:hypothetical protein